jgi:protein SCO1/2
MSAKKGYFKRAALAALIILPSLGIFFWAKATWVHQELPYIGERYYSAEQKDTVYHTVGDFILFNQHGKKITFQDFDNSIVVANIFFASCPEVCPEMNKQVQVIAEEYINEPQVKFLTVTIDPESDSVPVIMEYSKYYKADLYKRTFATGNKTEIYDWAINDLLLATEQRGADFIHDDRIVIIDKAHHIRSILPTRAPTNREKMEMIRRIKDDIENLKYEYRKQQTLD